MRIPVYLPTLNPRTLSLAASLVSAVSLYAVDPELTNYKSGIDVIWGVGDGSDKGTAYAEEYFYHDKLIDDHKVVYLKSTTAISMAHNARNTIIYGSVVGGRKLVGVNGLDGLSNTLDEGVIRYKLDRDRQYLYRWSQNYTNNEPFVLPAFTAPFTLASQQYESGVPVVGTTGPKPGPVVSDKTNYYFRGILDPFGDEWHTLAYADDDKAILEVATPISYEWGSDGKTVQLVVNPKTPCFTARVPTPGGGQFYTTKPKAYFTPKVVAQTTYITGHVTIELRDINGNNLSYSINGGTTILVGASTVTLDETNFTTGSNTLVYQYAGGVAKTRTVVKNPTHPSLAEAHGYYLLENPTHFAAVQSRLTRAPYLNTYNVYRNRSDFSGQADWDTWAHQGYRINPLPISYLQGGSAALINAFVARIEGFGFVAPYAGATKSHGKYAVEMLIENARTIDPLGFELSHSADTIPARELHYRGYYDAVPSLQGIFAYDIVAGNFRSDQVGAGGLTPIEDYFVRDTFAGFAYEGMQWSAAIAYPTGDAPLMWGGTRMMTAVSIAMIMPEYSTPYYGTSGFGSVSTTYPRCPYEVDTLTWKQALFDATAPKTSYPNYTWSVGMSDNGLNASLFMAEGETLDYIHYYHVGTWIDKAAYFDPGQVGNHLMIWANMAKLWGSGKTDPRLELAIESSTNGSFFGAKDPFPQTPARQASLLLMNSRWPNAVSNALAYIQSLPSSDGASASKGMDVFAFSWYDDLAGTGLPPPPPPPPPPDTSPANARVSISVH